MMHMYIDRYKRLTDTDADVMQNILVLGHQTYVGANAYCYYC